MTHLKPLTLALMLAAGAAFAQDEITSFKSTSIGTFNYKGHDYIVMDRYNGGCAIIHAQHCRCLKVAPTVVTNTVVVTNVVVLEPRHIEWAESRRRFVPTNGNVEADGE